MPQLHEEAPPEIIAAYQLDSAATITRLPGGHVNQTYRVDTPAGESSILQRISGELDPRSFRDADVVSAHLLSAGWDVPIALPTRDGSLFASDATKVIWRQLRYITSDEAVPEDETNDLMYAMGDMLGRWHRDVRTLKYVPQFGIPHFHDTRYYATRFRDRFEGLPDVECRELGTQLLALCEQHDIVTEQGLQVIHGDPKWANALFRGGAPHALIDFDTLLQGSIWIDIGDFLRSAIARRIKNNSDRPLAVIEPFMEGYAAAYDLQMPLERAMRIAALSTACIASELGIRYLDDIDGSYFSAIPEGSTRRDNHFGRAQLQWQVATRTGQATVNDITGGR